MIELNTPHAYHKLSEVEEDELIQAVKDRITWLSAVGKNSDLVEALENILESLTGSRDLGEEHE